MKFIRKNGRVIPIRDKDDKAKRKAAVATAAGAGAALVYSEYQRSSAIKEAKKTLKFKNQATELAGMSRAASMSDSPAMKALGEVHKHGARESLKTALAHNKKFLSSAKKAKIGMYAGIGLMAVATTLLELSKKKKKK